MRFKVNDWVRIKTPIFEYDGTDRIAEGIKKLTIKNMWIFDENHFKMNPDKYIEHWQPKNGEWCWFKDEKNTIGSLVQLVGIEEDGTYYGYSSCGMPDKATCVEPFIGKLPSFLKDK